MAKKGNKRQKIFVVSLSILLILVISLSFYLKSKSPDNKVYCGDEQRNVDACTQIYEPVCGYPIEETFGNSCLACLNEEIIYYAEGECGP